MISLPNQLELQTLFSGFLFEVGLSAVSVKNYLSDLRHFLSYSASISSPDNPPTVQEIFQSISNYLNSYLLDQKRSMTPQNTINRRLASIRRFSTFLSSKYGLNSDLQEAKNQTKGTSSPNNLLQNNDDDSLPTIKKILDHFKVFLVKEKKTHSTIKNYVSDLNHFFAWSANETPFLDQNLENILSESHLNTYVTYLKLSHTSTSVINRRQSSIKQFTKYCFLQKYIPTNPFEYKHETPRLLPLSWFERFSSSKNKHGQESSKSRLGIWYQKYNSLPFTPYLHLAILVLATSAMVIFGYNQIIKQALPSSAALPTIPRRQLSFQGRLTDSSGTPITTSVNVTFKLWNDLTAGTQLYTSGTCPIIPDPNGIFNTLIGNGTCGAEIANTVFTENRDVYLEVIVGAETLTPRQQIATVGYALNSETLQGYPASASATVNTVPIVDNNGDINIAASSPTINSTSGTFTLNGQALTLTTTANSGGDIILQPDALGGGQIQMLGGTTNTDFLRIENANLTSGALISGYVGNNTATGRLLSLTAGSTETDRFYVAANGQTAINTSATLVNAALIANQNGTGDLFTASASGVTKFTIANNGNITATGTLTGLTGLTVSSGTVSLPNGEINNAEISELDWTKLQNYPSACPAGEAIQAVGDTLTCVSISAASGNLWQLNSGALTPANITNSINIGATATASALVHLAGTTGDNSFINTGNFGIGLTNPAYKLDVTGDINLTGALRDNGSAGTPGQILSTTGTGVEWINSPTSSGAGPWNWNTGVIFPFSITDAVNLGNAATASATVHLAGTTGDNSFINTGNFGIGLTNPAYKLDVTGDINLTGALRDNGSAGNAGDILSSTGTGVQWIAPSTFSGANQGWTWNTGVLYPTSITDAVNLGNAATASATVHLAGTAGDNSFINTGNFGIGLTNPAYKLDVVGDVNTTGSYLVNGVPLTSSNWQRTSGSLAPLNITDSVNIGAVATASALVHLAGTTGDNSFINTGNFGIGLTNPAYKLDVTGDINLTGALYDNGSAGNAGDILSSTGTGVQWIAPSTFSGANQGWTWNTGVLYPTSITDAVNLGNAATASATVHLAGTAGDNSFINTGNFGIGLTNPATALDVVGVGQFSTGLTLTSGALNLTSTSGALAITGLGASTISTTANNLTLSTVTSGTLALTSAGALNLSAGAASTWTLANVVNSLNFDSNTLTIDALNNRIGIGLTNPADKLQIAGNILPTVAAGPTPLYNLGSGSYPWLGAYLASIYDTSGVEAISVTNHELTQGDWFIPLGGLRINGSSPVPAGYSLWVDGNASVSGTLSTGGQLTVGNGAGKIDVGTVDPPYTINGTKYATYMASMIGIKEETVGKVATMTENYIEGLGYRTLIKFDQQEIGSDLWLFNKTTNIQSNIDKLSVLLTPEGQAKAWYEVDKTNKILAIYSSTPTNITYRLTAPRFDSYKWSNLRTSASVGHLINDSRVYDDTNGIFANPVTSPELIQKVDGTYALKINSVENKEVASFMKSIIANLQAGAAVIANLVTDNLETSNLTVKTKLISPLADIDQLKTIDATISGTLYADNIKSETVDNLRTEINLLDKKYSTASGILADLEARYSTYSSLFGATSSAIISGDPLALSPLAKTTPIIPSDLALNSLNVHTLITNDMLANGAIFTQSISAFDTDLYIQPTGDKLVYISNKLMILDPDGKVVVNGDLLVTGNLLSKSLDTQTATVSGTLAVGSSTIATESARFTELTTDGLIIASGNNSSSGSGSTQTNTNATIGTGTITANTTEINILNTKITDTTLIYVTPTSDTGGEVLYVKSKQSGVGFTIAIAKKSTADISFNFWLVETK